jgi:hypothetical protein
MRLFFIIAIVLASCAGPHDPNDLGTVTYLPKGEYIIWNTGSRHMVKCQRPDGKCYWLNDSNFDINGIPARDAHEFRNKTRITIK